MIAEDLVVTPQDSIERALEVTRASETGDAIVVAEGEVLGIVTDGDIRQALLEGVDIDDGCHRLVTRPVVVTPDASDDDVRALLQENQVGLAAVVDRGRLVGVRVDPERDGDGLGVCAVVLAGGRGQRLRPLTDRVPKPLLRVGRTTIIERLLEQIRSAGITQVHLAVNYKAELFEQRLGSGEHYGLDVRYLREREALGTAGPLSLLDPPPAIPILVTMADQVTTLPFRRMVSFHRQQGAAITVAAFRHEVPIPYGVLRLDAQRVLGIEEKPTLARHCNAGIFVIEPEVVALVPADTMFGMPDLVEAALAKGWPVSAFPILERWIDVGSPEALEAALMSFAAGEEV